MTTPVMAQYLAAKSAHKDALLFFRLGDFYELFFEDAVTAARALELTLTSRNKGASDEIPMAGVPHHAASGYIQRLLDQGFKVAICEQMADPSKVKGIVPREVVRVVTPGLVYDDVGLDARQNHFLVALEAGAGGTFGISALDASTGELLACEAPTVGAAIAELARLDPREVLAGPGTQEILQSLRLGRTPPTILEQPDSADERCLDTLLGSGEAQASCPNVAARHAAARCVAYVVACEPGRVAPLPVSRLAVYALDDTLVLDEATQGHLELVRTLGGETRGALLPLLDATQTACGARLLRRRLLAPRTKLDEIRRRLDGVELFALDATLRAEVRARLDRVGDVERLAIKFATDRAGPRDLAALRNSLQELPALGRALESSPATTAREAFGIAPGEGWVDLCEDLCDLLTRAVVEQPPAKVGEGAIIADGFDIELDDARAMAREGNGLIVKLEARWRDELQISTLKLRSTRVFGWYIEVTRQQSSKAPPGWRRKQTVANAERYTCDELDTLADKLANVQDRLAQRESSLFAMLVKDLGAHATRLRAVAQRLAELDVASSLADTAHRYDYVRPDVDDSLALEIEGGRHPVVERLAAAGRFVPNDVSLDAQGRGAKRLWMITGPNMAGKSTLMRQTALIVILAQMGSFVPAKRARVGIVDRVLTRVGASDNLARGDSTFMVEMKETAGVLRRATRRSLVVVDEIGRGTSTYDGLAIAWAVAEHLHDAIGCRALFATHYHELTELSSTRSGMDNWSVSAREHDGEVVFLHKLAQGAASRSYGVACARLAGLPEPVLARARALLADLEGGGGVRRVQKASPQLALFAPAVPNPVLETLRAVDVNRLTPLEALQLIVSLKAELDRAS